MIARPFELAALAAAALPALPAHAAVAIGSPASVYSQNFDSLTTATGTGVPWVNDGTLAGWSLFDFNGNAITSYGADDGSSNAGSFRSYGAAGAGDRALGSVGSGGAYFGSPPSGSVAGYQALALGNATGVTLTSFTLSFAGEQWRNGGNTSAQTMVLQYGFGATFAAVSGWSTPGGRFNFTSPVVGATAAAVDGNGAGRVDGLGGTVVANWTPGTTLWLRWVENNDVGNDHGLAVDDLALRVTAVPEPTGKALLMAGLAGLGWLTYRRRP